MKTEVKELPTRKYKMPGSKGLSEAGKAGVICLSALWGTTAKAEELKSINADYIFETVGELKNYLMKNTNQKPEEAPIP